MIVTSTPRSYTFKGAVGAGLVELWGQLLLLL